MFNKRKIYFKEVELIFPFLFLFIKSISFLFYLNKIIIWPSIKLSGRPWILTVYPWTTFAFEILVERMKNKTRVIWRENLCLQISESFFFDGTFSSQNLGNHSHSCVKEDIFKKLLTLAVFNKFGADLTKLRPQPDPEILRMTSASGVARGT